MVESWNSFKSMENYEICKNFKLVTSLFFLITQSTACVIQIVWVYRLIIKNSVYANEKKKERTYNTRKPDHWDFRSIFTHIINNANLRRVIIGKQTLEYNANGLRVKMQYFMEIRFLL